MSPRPFLLLPVILAAACAAKTKSAAPLAEAKSAAPLAEAKPPLTYPAAFEHPELAKVPEAGRKLVVFFSDDGQHGWMQHENSAGSVLFAKRLAKAISGCSAVVTRDTFPDADLLKRAASVVLFCSGTDRHPLNKPENLAAMEKAMQAGTGLVVLHWGLEAGTPEGSAFLKNHLGGCFEVNYSVNPMWLADFKTIHPHPVTSGLAPFSIYDEFYFNMRFPDVPGARTNLLEAVPPKKVIVLPPDGPRSNNPEVRGSLGKPQVLAWTYERPGGGRAFGFTGGHFHWDWKHDDQRRLLLNGIAWSAKIDVPAGGIPDTRPDDAELLENQDSPPAPGWEPMPGQPCRDHAAAPKTSA